MYLHGLGRPKDAHATVRWKLKAAEQENAEAMCYLVDMYFQGVGTGQNDREAFRWYLTSVAAGFANCRPNLKAAEKRLGKNERNAAEREARAWAAELQDRLKQPRVPSQR